MAEMSLLVDRRMDDLFKLAMMICQSVPAEAQLSFIEK